MAKIEEAIQVTNGYPRQEWIIAGWQQIHVTREGAIIPGLRNMTKKQAQKTFPLVGFVLSKANRWVTSERHWRVFESQDEATEVLRTLPAKILNVRYIDAISIVPVETLERHWPDLHWLRYVGP